jgi:uncharacterized protein with PIN domain
MSKEPAFIVDTMLGRIARWLRILGYDTLYYRRIEDWRIIRIAEKENRIIVTRDRGLHRRALKRGLKSILLEDDDMASRLATIAYFTGIRLYIDLDRTRCPICNTPLRKAEKSEVRGKVPDKIYELHDDFWICPKCGKVYWIGSHWRMMEKILEEARRIYGMTKVRMSGVRSEGRAHRSR